jgi:hypothetical protein
LAVGIVGLLAACASPAEPLPTAPALPAGWRLELPVGYEHWRAPLQAELEAVLAAAEPVLARWPSSGRGGERRLEVLTPLQAAERYVADKRDGDPRVPRTFPAERVALVPLPREDRLLVDPTWLPQTWLHDLAHEAMHLACLDRPGLAEAPEWFLEGLAEWACTLTDPAASPGTWPQWTTADRWAPGTAEGLQCARRRAVQRLCADDSGARPWRGVAAPRTREDAVVNPDDLRLLRGRHAGWWPHQGVYLLAPPAGALVALDLPLRPPGAVAHGAGGAGRAMSVAGASDAIAGGGASDGAVDAALVASAVQRRSPQQEADFTWDGTAPLRVRLRAGDSGRYPDAGLLLVPDAAHPQGWLRLRIAASGAFLATAERPEARPTLEPLQADRATPEDDSREILLTLEDDLLRVTSGSFRRAFPLAEHDLAPPFALRLYAFDTAVRADLLAAVAEPR